MQWITHCGDDGMGRFCEKSLGETKAYAPIGTGDEYDCGGRHYDFLCCVCWGDVRQVCTRH
jgi:hypothetical protein